MRSIKIVLLISTIFFISINAQPKSKMPPPPPNGDFVKLDLTDAQKETMKELRFTHEEKLINLRSDMKKSELEIKRLLSEDNFTISEMKSLLDDKREIENKIEDERFNFWASVHNILDDTQKEKWEKKLMHQIGDRERRAHHNMRNQRMRMDF